MWGAAVVMPAAPCFLPEIQASSAAGEAAAKETARPGARRSLISMQQSIA
jgi:hypothetical protein